MRNFYYLLLSLFTFLSISLHAQFTESFENGIPSTWTVVNNGSTFGWTQGQPTDAFGNIIPAQDGTFCARINADAGNAHDDYLITPAIAVTAGTNGYISFWARNGFSFFPDLFDVKVSTTGTNPADFTITLAENITPPEAWTNYQYNLNGYDGQTVYVAIWAHSASNNQELDIDFFENFAGPNCPEVSNIAVTQNTGDQITLSWTNGNTETMWDIEYGETGFTPDGSVDETADSNPYTITGLTPDTTYDFYIRANCGGSDIAPWVGPFTVTTIINYCAGTQFLDTGGLSGNYSSNEFETWLISPINAGDRVSVTFSAFDTQLNSDILTVYNGPDNTFPVLGEFSGDFGDPTAPTYLASTDPSGSLFFEFSSNGFTQAAGWVADVTCEPIPTCLDITQINTSGITGESVIISWTPGDGQTSWNIEYGAAGFTQGSGTVVNTMDNPFTLTGLDPLTQYNFYIQGECSATDTSVWAGPFVFTTGCATFTPPYFEDFSAMTFSTPPACWEEAEGGDVTSGPATFGSSNWTSDGFANNGFNGAAKFNLFTTGDFDWLLSPTIDLGDGTTAYELKYNIAFMAFSSSATQQGFSDDDNVQVLIFANGVWNNLITYDSTNTPLNSVQIFDLSAYTGLVQFAFLADEASLDDASDVDVSIDNFEVRPIPDCTDVINLQASQITGESAVLGWDMGTGQVSWNIEYGPAGFALGSGTVVNGVTTNSYLLEGLDPTTDYDFYVQGVCDGGLLGAWSTTASFSTGCLTFTPVYFEDFSTMSFSTPPACWEEAEGGDVTNGPANFGSSNWTSDGFANIGSTGAAKFNLFTLGDFDWLLSPTIDLGDGTTAYELKFDIATMAFASSTTQEGFSDDDNVQVLIYSNGVWTNLITYDSTNTPLNSSQIFDLSTYTGVVQFAFLADEGSINDASDVDVSIDNFEVRPIPDCSDVVNLIASEITGESAVLSWDIGTGQTSWNIEYGPAGFTLGTGTLVSDLTTNTYTAEGLDATTDYDFYVQGVCDGGALGAWSNPGTFTTGCTTFTPIYTETFDTMTAALPPLCWQEAEGGDLVTGPVSLGTSNWVSDGYANNGFSGAAKFNLFTLGDFDWLISPNIDLGDGTTTYELKFDIATMAFGSSTTEEGFSDDDKIDVLIYSNGAWSVIHTYDSSNTPLNNTELFSLSGYTGVVQFAFLADEGTINDASDVDVSIDNFEVRPQPNCPEVTQLSISDNGVTELTVNWVSNGTETEWIIEYGPAGFTPGSGTTVTVTENPYTLTGLTSNTAYDVYVTASCTDEDSYVTGPVSGSTTPDYCAGDLFTDSGGTTSNYSNNENITYFVVPSNPGETVVVTFTEFDVEFGWDFLKVYDGPDTSFPPLHPGVGTSNEGFTGTTLPPVLTTEHPSGTLTFVFESDGIINAPGWVANVACVPLPTCIKPVNLQAFNATTNSIDLSWESDGTEFEITYVLAGGDPVTQGTIVSPNPTSSPYTVTGLDHSTVYDFYVRNVCSADDISNYTLPVTLNTKLPNDECETAVELTSSPLGEQCSTAVSGTINGASDSGLVGCAGTADDDVWYSFTAISSIQEVALSSVVGSSTNLNWEVFEGDCGNLTSIYCSDPLVSIIDAPLVEGETYYIRVFSNEGTPQDSYFLICVTAIAPPAENDDCDNAIVVESLPYENNQADYVTDGGGFIDGCDGGTNDGVWYTFIGDGADVVVEVTPYGGYDCEVGIFDTPCGSDTPNPVACGGSQGTDEMETMSFTTVAGTQYWINIGAISSSFDFPEGDFDISIYTNTTSVEDIQNTMASDVLYPNPTSGMLYYSGDKGISSAIAYDMSGSIVTERIYIEDNSLDISTISEGVYVIKLRLDDGSIESYKVIRN